MFLPEVINDLYNNFADKVFQGNILSKKQKN